MIKIVYIKFKKKKNLKGVWLNRLIIVPFLCSMLFSNEIDILQKDKKSIGK